MALHSFPPLVQKLIEEFGRLPGIGRKTATRMALYILDAEKEEALQLADAVSSLKEHIRFCKNCFNLSESDECDICRDQTRNQEIICVVEDPTGIVLIENTSEYNGIYHVLGGIISPLDGVGPDNLKIRELLNRISGVKEIIIALNPSTEGEATSIYLSKLLEGFDVKITRLARGIPLGSPLEFVDELTLGKALRGRSEF